MPRAARFVRRNTPEQTSQTLSTCSMYRDGQATGSVKMNCMYCCFMVFHGGPFSALNSYFSDVEAQHGGVYYSCYHCETTYWNQAWRNLLLLWPLWSPMTIVISCDHCDLKQHMKAQHEGICYSCNHCDYRVLSNNMYKSNMEVSANLVIIVIKRLNGRLLSNNM